MNTWYNIGMSLCTFGCISIMFKLLKFEIDMGTALIFAFTGFYMAYLSVTYRKG